MTASLAPRPLARTAKLNLYDGRSIEIRNPRSVGALLGLAVRYGFRKEGDQLFIRISSNRGWSQISGEPPVEAFLENLRSLGLY